MGGESVEREAPQWTMFLVLFTVSTKREAPALAGANGFVQRAHPGSSAIELSIPTADKPDF
jgi:hypothetical protein